MKRNRQQGISPELDNQLEPKQLLRRLESPNYDKDLSYLKRNNKSNASDERHQLNAIENVLYNFFKGEAIVRQLIANVNNSIIRNQFDKVAVQYFTSKSLLKKKEREMEDAMNEINHNMSVSLKN